MYIIQTTHVFFLNAINTRREHFALVILLRISSVLHESLIYEQCLVTPNWIISILNHSFDWRHFNMCSCARCNYGAEFWNSNAIELKSRVYSKLLKYAEKRFIELKSRAKIVSFTSFSIWKYILSIYNRFCKRICTAWAWALQRHWPCLFVTAHTFGEFKPHV